MQFVLATGGGFKTIPEGTQVKINEIKIAETGSSSSIDFGRATSLDASEAFGWNSTRNLKGKFMTRPSVLFSPSRVPADSDRTLRGRKATTWAKSILLRSWT